MNTCRVCALSESERWGAEMRLRTKRSHPAIAEELKQSYRTRKKAENLSA